VELVLVRHALPVRVENADGSPADPELSATGREQAQRVAHWLAVEEFDALYSSPMRRALETAEPIAERTGLSPILVDGVHEFDRGRDHYIPLEELKEQDYAAWKAFVQGGLYEGIDREAFDREVVGSLSGVARKHPKQRVVVVAHGGVINVWAAHVLGVAESPFFEPQYTSIHRFLVASSGEMSVKSLNENAHLRGVAA